MFADAVSPTSSIPLFLQTSTNPDGTYTLHGLPATAYHVEFSGLQGGFPRWWDGDTREAASAPAVSVTTGATTSGVDVHIPHAAVLTGTVHGDDGTAYAHACVSAFYSDGVVGALSATTASDGTYTIPDVAPGPTRVKFTDCSGVTAAQWYNGAASYSSATVLDLADGVTASGIDGVVARGLSISGHVVDDDGNPLQGAMVDLYDARSGAFTGREVSTDANGDYVVPGLRGTTYELSFRGPQNNGDLVARWWPASPARLGATPVSLAAGMSVTHIDEVLPHGATVSGHIVDEAGSPVKDVCVSPHGGLVTDGSSFAKTDDAGAFAVHGLDVGTYHFHLWPCGGTDFAQSWLGGTDMVSSGRTVNVALRQVVTDFDGIVHPGGSISGTVNDSGGNPLAGTCVTAERPVLGWLPTVVSTSTDSSGHYSLHGLWPHDDYQIRFDDCARGNYAETYYGWTDSSGTIVPVTVTAGNDHAGIDAVLRRAGFLSGTVIDQFGNRAARVGIDAWGTRWGGSAVTD
ncbi:MAG TPA: carboxypeptidase-like regulatory domain-containing protein, partial [Mycobacteriales bacterium]|nr:carboxypeptidase-like regulatory domain-containing protein [Mycobacteriales bacterium]